MDHMITVVEFGVTSLVSLVLVGGWTGAWLNWIFVGHLRHYALAALPEKIRRIDRETLASLTHAELRNYIICDLNVPEFVRRLLTCPTCFSLHCAWTGFVIWLVVLHQSGVLQSLAPAAWAGLLIVPAAAALGLNIHFRTHN